MNSLRVMKIIYKKVKQGHKLSNTQEFVSLIDLCSSDERAERLSACKCIFYLWDWKVIDNKTLLTIFTSVANNARYIDGILSVFVSVVSQQCEKGGPEFLKNELPQFQRTLAGVLTTHEPAVLLTISLFDQMDFGFVYSHYKPIILDIMYGDFSNRSLIWSLVIKRFNTDLHRNFLLWLKFYDLEDCFILLGSLKSMDISDTEKCLYLSVLIRNMLACGHNPQEAISFLKTHILNTSIHTQSMIILTFLMGLETLSDQYLLVAFNLYEWFLHNTMLWTEVLWIMLVYLIPFTAMSVFYPVHHEKALKLISIIKEKIETGNSIDLKVNEMKSVIYKYIIFRHNSLHQTWLVIRLLLKFKNDERNLICWLQKLLLYSDDQKFSIFDAIVAKLFLTSNGEVKRLSLTALEKFKGGNIYLYLFQLQREDDPIIINEILRIICSQHIAEGKSIIDQLLRSLSGETHDRSFNVKLALLMGACRNGYKFDDELHFYLTEKNNFIDVVTQAELVKTLAFHTSTNYEEIISFCNERINSVKSANGDLSTASIIDTIGIMCEKGVLDISKIWDNLLKMVAGEQHPAIHNSVCDLLSKIPGLLKHRQDENKVLYKSARVLWHFANDSKANQKLAMKCLREYEIDIFDSTFLSDECQTHGTPSALDDFTPTPIKGNCWMHLLKDDSFTELFVHFINKSKLKAKFRGSYAHLFEGMVHYLSSCSLDDGENITKSLKILAASWINVPAGKDLSFLGRFLSNSSPNFNLRDLTVFVILNHFCTNLSAKLMFENFLAENNCTNKQKAIMCLLPGKLLDKQRAVNEDILFDGLLYALDTDAVDLISGDPLNTKIEKVIISFSTIYGTTLLHRRLIMKVLFTLWIKTQLHSQVFNRVSKLLAVIYGYPFLKSICSHLEGQMCRKYIYLSKEIALHTKLMRCYDINVGLRHECLRDEVVEHLLDVLQQIGQENKSRNLKWMLRVLCMCAMTTNDYLCQVVIYSMNYLSGVHLFGLGDSMKVHLMCFPLSVSVVSKLTRKGKNITLTMHEIAKKTLRAHSAFIEAFKLGVLRIRDEPSITFETVTKKCIE